MAPYLAESTATSLPGTLVLIRANAGALQDRGSIGLRYDAAWLELYGSNSPFDFLV